MFLDRLDAPVARFHDGEGCEGDEARGDHAEQPGAVGSVVELRERSVEPDRLVRLVVDRRFDQEDADEAEDNRAREVANGPDGGEPLLHRGRHLLGFRVVEELLADSADELVEAYSEHHEPRDTDEPAAGRPAEDVVRRLVCVARLAARAHQDLDGDRAHHGVRDAAAERAEPVEAPVGALGTVAERGTGETPEGVASEADGQDSEEQVPEGVVFDGAERSLLVRDLAAAPEGQVERQDADDPVDEAARNEPRAREVANSRELTKPSPADRACTPTSVVSGRTWTLMGASVRRR